MGAPAFDHQVKLHWLREIGAHPSFKKQLQKIFEKEVRWKGKLSAVEAHELLCEKLRINYKTDELRSRILHPHDNSVRQVEVPEGCEADDLEVNRVEFDKQRGRSRSSPPSSRTGKAKA